MGRGAKQLDRPSLLFRLHRARLTIIAIVLFAAGIVLLLRGSGRVADALSTTLLTTGGLSVFFDFAARVIGEERVIELLKRVLNTVLYGPFRALFEKMTRAKVQRHDVRIDVTLTAAGTGHDDMIMALVRYAYRTNAPLAARVFLCSHKHYSREYYERHGITEYWTVDPARGIAADDPTNFTVLDYKINGVPHEIERTADNGEQTYRVAPRDVTASSGGLYHEEYTYRTLVPRHGGSLYFTIDVPTCNFSLEVSHFNSDIGRLSLTNFFASETEPRINESTASTPKPATVDVDGWIMPVSGVDLKWTLNESN